MYNYSSSYEVAEFINENLPDNSILVSNNMPLTSSIIPYTENGIKYWNPCFEDYFSYVIWNEKYLESMRIDFIQKINENFDEDDNIYYIFSYNIPCDKETDKIEEYNRINNAEENGYLTKIFESSFSLSDETYILYKVNNK